MLAISIGSLTFNQLQLGLDFTGGALVEVSYSSPVSLNDIRDTLARSGFPDAVVQTFGTPTEVLIRLATTHTPSLGDEVVQALRMGTEQSIKLLRAEYVGAQVGEDLREQGGLGMLLALGGVMLYVALRFQIKFAVGAVVALLHDVLIVLGVFSVFKLEFDLTVLAAILAVIGYSLNDSLVVADRIRENFRKLRTETPLTIINRSLTETLGRTLMTSITTLLVLVALFIFGGTLIHCFATALLVGVTVGTYSSIYVASSLLLWMDIKSEDLIGSPEKDAEMDDRP
tara:strand:+ start:15549 stop:16403 length:855 start_codon:yes stop_codon:yes gene_type:complete